MAENYIYYNYNNYLAFEKGKDLVKQAETYFKDARRIMNAQLSRFRSLQQAKNNKILMAQPSLSLQDLENLYNLIDANPNFLTQVEEQSLQRFAVDEFGNKIVNFELSEFEKMLSQGENELSVLTQGVRKFNEALTGVVAPDQMHAFMKASFEQWFRQAKQSGFINKHWPKSKAAMLIVQNFINKNASGNKFFTIPDGNFGTQEIDQRYAKIAALLYSIQLIHENGQGGALLQGINVQSGGNTITGSSGQKLATLFSQQASGLIVNVKESSHMAAAGAAGIQAMSKAGEAFSKLKWSYLPIGNNTIQVKVIEREDTAFKQLQNYRKKKSSITKKVSKGDLSWFISDNRVVTEILRATLKTNITSVPNIDGSISHEIKLHDTTNLLHFLRREGGLTAGQFNSLMQLLAGHGDDGRIKSEQGHTSYSTGDLTNAWETIKQGIKYNAALNVISGYGLKDFSGYAIIGDRMISVEHILQQITNEINASGTGSMLDIKFIGNVDKTHYTASWVSGSKQPWLQRSTDAWVGLGQLESVQVQVKLLVNNTQALLRF